MGRTGAGCLVGWLVVDSEEREAVVVGKVVVVAAVLEFRTAAIVALTVAVAIARLVLDCKSRFAAACLHITTTTTVVVAVVGFGVGIAFGGVVGFGSLHLFASACCRSIDRHHTAAADRGDGDGNADDVADAVDRW